MAKKYESLKKIIAPFRFCTQGVPEKSKLTLTKGK